MKIIFNDYKKADEFIFTWFGITNQVTANSYMIDDIQDLKRALRHFISLGWSDNFFADFFINNIIITQDNIAEWMEMFYGLFEDQMNDFIEKADEKMKISFLNGIRLLFQDYFEKYEEITLDDYKMYWSEVLYSYLSNIKAQNYHFKNDNFNKTIIAINPNNNMFVNYFCNTVLDNGKVIDYYGNVYKEGIGEATGVAKHIVNPESYLELIFTDNL